MGTITGKCSSHTAQSTESKGRDGDSEVLPTIEDKVQGRLRHLKVHKSMGPDEMPLKVLRESADAKPLSITFGKLWHIGEVPSD